MIQAHLLLFLETVRVCPYYGHDLRMKLDLTGNHCLESKIEKEMPNGCRTCSLSGTKQLQDFSPSVARTRQRGSSTTVYFLSQLKLHEIREGRLTLGSPSARHRRTRFIVTQTDPVDFLHIAAQKPDPEARLRLVQCVSHRRSYMRQRCERNPC